MLGGNVGSIAKAALAVEGVKEAIVKQLLGNLNQECNTLCKKQPTSLFRKIPVDRQAKFRWEDMITELQQNAPLLLKMLTCLVARNDCRNTFKIGSSHYPGLCTALAILLKERNREMCGLQSLVALLMYSCHCEKQV